MSARFPALRRPTKLQQVTLNAPVKRVLLGEGRQLYLIASLEPEDPLALVVARRTDLIVADPATYAQLHPVRELREFHQSLSPTFPVWSLEDLASDAGFEYGPLSCR